MKQITNVNLESDNAGGTVEVTYSDDTFERLTCSLPVALVIANLATTLKQERATRIATGDRLRRMYTRDSDMITRSGSGASTTSTAPTSMDAEFMRLVRAVAPKYDNALPDTDPRLVALPPRHSVRYTRPRYQRFSLIRLSTFWNRLATTCELTTFHRRFSPPAMLSAVLTLTMLASGTAQSKEQ